MRGVATSTVAMTIYNLLATGGGARTLGEIELMLSGWAATNGFIVSASQVTEAVKGLVQRRFLRDMGRNGLFDVTDCLRRPVVQRDRSDADQSNPGWRGWRVYARPVSAPKMVQLEDLV